MRQRELARLIKSLEHLTCAHRQKVAAELAVGARKAASVAIVEGRLEGKPRCPHCPNEHVVRNGTAHDLQRYKCRDCRPGNPNFSGFSIRCFRERHLSHAPRVYADFWSASLSRSLGSDRFNSVLHQTSDGFLYDRAALARRRVRPATSRPPWPGKARWYQPAAMPAPR